jgi:DNA gyrase subunit A
MAELVNQGKLEGIADLRDESDREGIRVVIELKRDVNPQKVLNALYRQTALQSNFGITMLALDNGLPRQMSLREMLQSFLAFREETLTRRYGHELEQAENRYHIVQGLLIALENLDALITILRHAPDGSTAKAEFQQRFDLSDRQSDAILAMPLRRLTGIERDNLQKEAEELSAQISGLQTMLGDRRELLKALKKDLRSLKKKFGDDRRTRILTNQPTAEAPPKASSQSPTIAKAATQTATQKSQAAAAPLLVLDPSLEEPDVAETVLELTQRGYARRITPKAFQRQARNRSGEAIALTLTEVEDFAIQTQFTTTISPLIAITRSGKAYSTPIGEIPQATARSKGVPLITLLPAAAQTDPDGIVGSFVMPENYEGKNLLIITQQGRVKRLPLDEFLGITGRGLITLKLKEEEQIASILIAQPGDQLVLAASSGRMLRVEVNDEHLPIQSRTAQGQLVMRLGKRERFVGAATASQGGVLLLMTERGYAKRMPIAMLRQSNPGELGAYGMQFKVKTDALVGLAGIRSETAIMVLTQDRMVRLDPETAPMSGRDTPGDRILKLEPTEKVETLIIISAPDSSDAGTES